MSHAEENNSSEESDIQFDLVDTVYEILKKSVSCRSSKAIGCAVLLARFFRAKLTFVNCNHRLLTFFAHTLTIKRKGLAKPNLDMPLLIY